MGGKNRLERIETKTNGLLIKAQILMADSEFKVGGKTLQPKFQGLFRRTGLAPLLGGGGWSCLIQEVADLENNRLHLLPGALPWEALGPRWEVLASTQV